MTRHPDPVLRDALRARLESEVRASATTDRTTSSSSSSSSRRRTFWVTGVVAVAVIVSAALVIRIPLADQLSGGRGGAVGGSGAAVAPAPTETLPSGKVLGRFTSEDGPNQDHTIHPGKLAMATQFICTGQGAYSVFTAGGTGESGDGGCDGNGGVGSGNGTSSGTASVKIRTDPDMKWTYTIVGIQRPTQVTPSPIATPTDTTSTPVPYCTSNDLTARFNTISAAAASAIGYKPSGEIAFTNETTRTCALAGYPEVRFLDAGKPLGHNTMNQIDPRRSVVNGLRAVILAPGGSAYSQVDWYKPGDNKQEGPCVARAVTKIDVELHYDLATPQQTGQFTVPIGKATACLNGAHGALGKYGQISSTVFVNYSLNKGK